MRRYLLLLLPSFLTTFAIYASVDVPPALIQNYTVSDYKASGQNWDLVISPDGILFVANNSGLLTFDGNTWTTFPLPDNSIVKNVELSNDTVFTRSETSVGYWLRDKIGKLVYYPLEEKPAHITFKEETKQVPIPLAKEIVQQKPSTYTTIDHFNFVGTLANGIYVTDAKGNSLLSINKRVGLQDNIVHDICVEKSGYIWAAFDNGLSRIIFNSPLRLLATRSRVGKLLDVAYIDSTLYFKTNTNYYKRSFDTGVYAFPVPEEEALPYFSQPKEKDNRTIKEIVGNNEKLEKLYESDTFYPVSDSLYWFIKGNEAAYVSLKDDSITLKCRILFSNFNQDLAANEEHIFPLNDSLHIASTMQGVLLINTNNVIRSACNIGLPLRFTRIEYRDSEGIHTFDPNSTEISLPHNYHELTLYAGSSIFYLNNQISYKIEGISLDWSEWQQDGTINLFQLPHGDYTVSVRRYASTGSYPVISLEVEVRSPWYRTTGAIFMYIMLFLLAVQLWIRQSLIKQRRKEKQLRQIEKEEEERKMQQLRNDMLESELQNKKNELMLQTSTLVEKGTSINKLLKELDRQKEALGDRYPDKLYQRMRSLLENNLTSKSDWLAFESYFNSAHQDFIERFRQTYGDITNGDIRMCCLLRMNLSTKEIASILNISIRAVEIRRHRLRKRIGLDSEINLTDFLMNF